MKHYEVILQYCIDGDLLQWRLDYWFSWMTVDKDNRKRLESIIKSNYPEFEIVQITQIS